ncbi:hypothetical protein F5X97DRAFT_91369 [Nemania serpens]|nr:hypothetical protein F5X97DRAFT_91369 [Nemania serpens]
MRVSIHLRRIHLILLCVTLFREGSSITSCNTEAQESRPSPRVILERVFCHRRVVLFRGIMRGSGARRCSESADSEFGRRARMVYKSARALDGLLGSGPCSIAAWLI